MSFTWGGSDKTFGSTTAGNTESEVLNMPQFAYSLILSYDTNENRSNPNLTLMAEKLLDNPVSFLNASFISETWHKSNAMNYGRHSYKFDAVDYMINSVSISREEIIKMAESIK